MIYILTNVLIFHPACIRKKWQEAIPASIDQPSAGRGWANETPEERGKQTFSMILPSFSQ
jgi:hypothetical protein